VNARRSCGASLLRIMYREGANFLRRKVEDALYCNLKDVGVTWKKTEYMGCNLTEPQGETMTKCALVANISRRKCSPFLGSSSI